MSGNYDQIYLDYAATTPCDQAVIDEMILHLSTVFGNPNSLHVFGERALDSLNRARALVAELINAEPEEIIFTSGSTESNRIAIERTVIAANGKFVTTKTEHKSVLDCYSHLKSMGSKVSLAEVCSDGSIDIESLEGSLEDACLFSVCMVNNETGVLQDIANMVRICRKYEVMIHIDATQAFGKIPIDVKKLDVDFLSASGHKIYAPKGIGVLFCKKKFKKLLRVPNANHEVEFGIRSGTVPVPLCAAFGKAAEIARSEMDDNYERISKLRKILVDGLLSQLDEIYINGSKDSNYPGIVNISFRGCEGEALMMECPRLSISSGSACTSNKLSISHVLAAMNVPHDIAQSSIRISIGKWTTESDIKIAIEELVRATRKLRAISPIWDMIVAGTDVDSVFNKGRASEI
jgi:cysteine desulfurase